MAPFQPVIFGCSGPVLTPQEAAFFRDAAPFGFILFARNVEDPAQLSALCAALRAAVGWQAPILIDQEGGRVARMRAPHWREHLPPLDLAQSRDPARAFWLRGRLLAEDLRAVGIDVNCTPSADIATPRTHPFLKNRCYGTEPGQVTALARALADGQAAGGVLPVMKHMPGHGRATVDSHLDLPRVREPADVLRQHDFAPFHALADLPMGMSAHVIFEAFDAQHPATQSPRMIDLIRSEIGFDGLLMTDDISMQALSGSVAQRSLAALSAGCDVVLHCNGKMDEMAALADAVPAPTAQALARAQAALASRSASVPVDIAACAAELEALERGV